MPAYATGSDGKTVNLICREKEQAHVKYNHECKSLEVFTQTLNESQNEKVLMPKRNLRLKAQQLLK